MKFFKLFLFVSLFLAPMSVAAAISDSDLASIYNQRPDLQKAFDETGVAVPNSAAGFLIDLTDWAEQYGWREYSELSAFAPASEKLPQLVGRGVVPEVTANSYIVVDKNSGLILAEKKSSTVWPIASITKLMTASLVLDSGVDLYGICSIEACDEVGGARLYVNPGADFILSDLIYAALVGSANNAANAIARAADDDKEDFVAKMNERAADYGLPNTVFTDPTGIEPTNVSTAREIARFTREVFSRPEIRQYTGTANRTISVLSTGEEKKLVSTNWLLWKPAYDDIYVMAGKTGYLEESGWNVVTALRPIYTDANREIIVVVFGTASRGDSMNDARDLAEWTWTNYRWK
ncbi:MAG: serine hydrolase [Patescibacteria group bacterium]|jgi:D-alanyl-D-alanine endopeptidase (penicillin-binding protein 7)